MIKKTAQPKQKTKKRFSIGAVIYGVLAVIVIIGGIAGFMLTQAPEGTDDRGQAYENPQSQAFWGDYSYFLAWDGKENKYYWRGFATPKLGNNGATLISIDGSKLSFSELQKLNISSAVYNSGIWSSYVYSSPKSISLSELTKHVEGGVLLTSGITSFDMFYLEFNPNGESIASQDIVVDGKHYYRFARQNPGDATPKNWTPWKEDKVGKPGSGLITSYTTSLDYVTNPSGPHRRTVFVVSDGVVYSIKETKAGKWLQWQEVPANQWPSNASQILQYSETVLPREGGSFIVLQRLTTKKGSWYRLVKPDGITIQDWK